MYYDKFCYAFFYVYLNQDVAETMHHIYACVRILYFYYSYQNCLIFRNHENENAVECILEYKFTFTIRI